MPAERTITWNAERFKALRTAHKAAVQRGQDVFIFHPKDGGGPVEFVTAYAKYLIEYLSLQFRGKS